MYGRGGVAFHEQARSDRNQRRQNEVTRIQRRDSLFNDENASVPQIRSSRPGIKPIKGKTVALPDKMGKRKRTFEEQTNRVRNTNNDDATKRMRSPFVTTFESKSANKPTATVVPQKQEKTSTRLPKVFSRNRSTKSSSKLPVSVPKPLNKDLSDLKKAVNEVKVKAPRPPGVEDIDASDRDIFHCPVYAHEIIQYTKSMESRFQLPEDFADKCPGKGKSRGVLLDWLIQVQNHLNIQQQTLHLAVHMIDQVLAAKDVPLHKIQLLGITSLLIATKYEERFPPSIAKLLHLTDNSYVHQEVIQMELTILNILKCELHMPTPIIFLERGLKVIGNNKQDEMLARFILDLTLPFVKLVQFTPSVKAAAAIYLAHQILTSAQSRPCTWILSLSYYLSCEETDILTCAIKFAKLLDQMDDHKFQGARQKYAQKSHLCISKHECLRDNRVIKNLSDC